MLEFENKNAIFPIDRSLKFVLLVWQRKKPSEKFRAAFYLQNIQSLTKDSEREKFVDIPIELVRKISTDSLSIPEVHGRFELQVLSRLFDKHSVLSSKDRKWTVEFVDEFHDKDSFLPPGKGWPIITGNSFQQFMPDFEKPEFSIPPSISFRTYQETQDNVQQQRTDSR